MRFNTVAGRSVRIIYTSLCRLVIKRVKRKNISFVFHVFITEPPDIPEKLLVEVTGNDSVKLMCIEADNPESAICTKFNSKYNKMYSCFKFKLFVCVIHKNNR